MRRGRGAVGKQVSRSRSWHTLKVGTDKAFMKFEYFIPTVTGLKYTRSSSKELLKPSSSFPALWVSHQSLNGDTTKSGLAPLSLGVMGSNPMGCRSTQTEQSANQATPEQSPCILHRHRSSASLLLLPTHLTHCQPGQTCKLDKPSGPQGMTFSTDLSLTSRHFVLI